MNQRNMLLILVTVGINIIAQPSIITYLGTSGWGGRFGDQMMMYIKAKWVASHHKMPFYYKQFKYSEQLMMHEMETPWNPNLGKQFSYQKELRNIETNLDAHIQKQNNGLYIVHYYFMMPHWGQHQTLYDSQEIAEWSDVIDNEQFRDELRKTIAPRYVLNTIVPPEGRISIAVHVRKGGGFDWPLLSLQQYDLNELDAENTEPYITQDIYSDRFWPLKFPPDQFYIDQIKRISTLLQDAPLYVHVFTDDSNPQKIVESYQQAVNKPNILYGCRTSKNHHTANILEDLFSMAQCDCFIRAGSNFPQIAQLIGKHRIVIFPKSMKWIGKVMIIDDVGTIMKGEHHS